MASLNSLPSSFSMTEPASTPVASRASSTPILSYPEALRRYQTSLLDDGRIFAANDTVTPGQDGTFAFVTDLSGRLKIPKMSPSSTNAAMPSAAAPSLTSPQAGTAVPNQTPSAVGAPGEGAIDPRLLAYRNYIGDIPSGWAVGANTNRGTGINVAGNALTAARW